MERDLAADQILSLSSDQIPRRKLDTAITVLLLLKSGPDWTLAYRGLQQDRYQIDSRLVVTLLNTADKKAQLAIVRSPAFWHLPKQLFRRHFFRLWRSRRRDVLWRWALGQTLHPFLVNNSPKDAPAYAKIIWTLVGDADEGVALAGLSSTRFLGPALTVQQAETLLSLTHHASMRAGAAMSNLGSLYKDIGSLRPEVQDLILSSKTIAVLRNANPPDGRGKWSCYRWCITNMQKALALSRRRRTP
ncbi:MAG TPA: hypothetical protein VFA20_03085 [Myxococcaceae bacterium]|nr:hypothetical protein [Myxococcaceae bacterium]